jgi:hypothetical protein
MSAWSWMIALAVGAILASCPLLVRAEEDESGRVADAAQAAFRDGVAHRDDVPLARGHFRRAAELYSQLVSDRDRVPEVFLARGKAWLLAGDVARAIVAFRQGRRRFPADENLRRALSYARSQVEYDRPEDRAVLAPRTDKYAGLKQWLIRRGAWAIAIISTIGCVLSSRWVTTRRTSVLLSAGIAMAIAVALLIACFVEQRQRQQHMSEHAIVVARPTILRSGDGAAYSPRLAAPIPAGVEAIVRYSHADWLQIELADGSLAWLPRAAVLDVEKK